MIDKFEFGPVIKRIADRLREDHSHLDEMWDVFVYEALQEFKRLGIENPTDVDMKTVINTMFDTGVAAFKIEVGDFKFDFKDFIINNIDQYWGDSG